MVSLTASHGAIRLGQSLALPESRKAVYYYCMTRCVRGALLLGEESFDRRLWIERRIEKLAEIFAVSVGGFAVMDNHFHVLLRLDADVACD
jgi:REP element-mobilizing transposase RayT